jgi:sec-independent protein translocase protein TatB
VLGPEKLPRVVSEFGRWVGRARAMARQFREQLEEEVQLEEARKNPMSAAPPPPPAPAAPPPPPSASPASSPPEPEPPVPPRPPTFSHAHPTDDSGADTTARAPASAGPDEPRT